MRKATSLILQIAMVMGAVCYRLNEARGYLSVAQQEASAKVTRALELLKEARTAMGGEGALKTLQSLSIDGTSRRAFEDKNGQAQERSGKIQIHLALSDKPAGKAGVKLDALPEGANHDRVFVHKGTPAEGSSGEGAVAQPRKRVMRLGGPAAAAGHPMGPAPLHFLMTSILGAPAPFPIEYSYAGEARTEAGDAVDIVEAKYPGGLVVRLSLDKQTHLPLGLSYRALMPPIGDGNVVVFRSRIGKEGEAAGTVMPAPEAGHDEMADVLVERRVIDEEGAATEGKLPKERFQISLPPPQEVEAQVSLSDYRVVGGILLPHRITQTFSNKSTETWEVERYEINSPPRMGKLRKQD
ncbi:MAG: hypothetical protein WCF57_19260 [Pyrinomonadaceae bacterium]